MSQPAGGSGALSENEVRRVSVCMRVFGGASACQAHLDAELDSIQLPK